MPRKLTQPYIVQAFEYAGWKLKDTYTGSKIKMLCECPEGHDNLIKWDDFQQGNNCPVCYGNKKLDYDYVKHMFKEEGYLLVSKTYEGSKIKLKYICPKGHKGSQSWNTWKSGKRCKKCAVENKSGRNSSLWKGGVKNTNLPLYTTYAPQLNNYQNTYKVEQDGLFLLGVGCHYNGCKKIFVPKTTSVIYRLTSLARLNDGECSLYCSEECKHSCSTFKQKDHYKDFKPGTYNRPDQRQWAKLVKERDSFTCQICGVQEEIMIAHHIDPVSQNPIESADIDNGVTLCKNCDKKVHTLPGCNYNELKCTK